MRATTAVARELALQRLLTVWIITGLTFMLLPGTFLGVWNLISIAGERTPAHIDPAWIQAHGHAQLFGWIGTFILGIGFYSLSKMGAIPEFAVSRGWLSWALWTSGVTLRWATNVWQWQWRWMLPLSALLELGGFVLFFVTVRRHRPEKPLGAAGPGPRPAWMVLVVFGSIGFLASLLANAVVAAQGSIAGSSPAVPHAVNQRLLALFGWGFPVLTIWGFSARWLPVFLGLNPPSVRLMFAALAADVAGILAAAVDSWRFSTAAIAAAVVLACCGLRIFAPSLNPPKIIGVHRSFPTFVRLAYGWLAVSACLAVSASLWDRAGGLWGSSRHALTVGFMSTMVFAIGQRVLPAFCGMRVLYSPALMFWSLALLNAGCLLRVVSEVGAYESYAPALWPLLSVSAILEMAAVTIFAASLLLTFRQLPAHLMTSSQEKSGQSVLAS